MTVVLDSWALIRYLYDEGPAASKVAGLLEAERPVVSWINLGEVFYVVRRTADDAAATATVRDLREVTTADLPDAERIIDAARIKADHPMAYADAFAAATAMAHDAPLDGRPRAARRRGAVALARRALSEAVAGSGGTEKDPCMVSLIAPVAGNPGRPRAGRC